jgi:hypothetical protein
MQRTSGKPGPINPHFAQVDEALPPPGAAPRCAVQKPLSPRAMDQPVGPAALEDPVGPDHELRVQQEQQEQERAFYEKEIARLTLVVDLLAQAGETGGVQPQGSGQSSSFRPVSSLRDEASERLMGWQTMLAALDARAPRDAALQEHKSQPAHVPSGALAPAAAQDDAVKAQRKLDKKARQALRQQAGPAERIQQAVADGRPEAQSLVNFIVDHFDGCPLPQTDDAWHAIPQWVGFKNNLSADAQNLARDFGGLSADDRNASTVMVMVNKKHQNAARAVAPPRKPEQKDPGPPRVGVVSARQKDVMAARPVVFHLAQTRPQKPLPVQPKPPQQLQPEAQAQAQPEPTPLKKFSRQEETRAAEALVLADFIAGHFLIHTEEDRELATIQQWPGFDKLDRHVKRLADSYSNLSQVDRPKAKLFGGVMALMIEKSAAQKAVAHTVPTATELSTRLDVKQREERMLQAQQHKLSEALQRQEANLTPEAGMGVRLALIAMAKQKEKSLAAIKQLPLFRRLSPAQRKTFEMRFEHDANHAMLREARREIDELIGQLPAQEAVLHRLDKEFADALAKNPAATYAMNDFLGPRRAPDLARGERHVSMPGADALAPEVMELLQLADELTVQGRLCGQMSFEIMKRDRSIAALPQSGGGQGRPDAGLARHQQLRQRLLYDEQSRETADFIAMNLRVQERDHPDAVVALDKLLKAQPVALKPDDIRYSAMSGFAQLGEDAIRLGQMRDQNTTTKQELNQVLAHSEVVLLGLS